MEEEVKTMIPLFSHLRIVRVTLLVFGLALLVVVSVRASVSAPSLAPITQWNSAISLPALMSPAAVAINRPSGSILIVAGGMNAAGNPVANVRRASVLMNGSISTWTDQPPLSVALFNHTLVASSDGNYLFVIVGWNGANRVRDVWRATVAANGSIGAWSKMTNRDYPIAVATADGVVVGERVYVVGGTDSTGTPRRNIYSATIASDGSLGAWRPERDLQKGLSRHAVAAYNGFLYVTGGDDGTIAQNTIYYAQINTDGSLAGWQTATLPARRLYHRAVIQDNQLVILGGSTDNVNGQSTVYRAPINANGSLGAWATQQPMPKALFRHGAVVVPKNSSEYVFVLGGLQGANSQDAVYYSNVPKSLRYLPLVARRATATPTNIPTRTRTPTFTPRATNTPTIMSTRTRTPTATQGPSPTPTPTHTPSATPNVGEMQGVVFNDVNGNLLQDVGEPGLFGAVIALKQGNETLVTAMSDVNGFFRFQNVPPGVYTFVEQSSPSGYELSPSLMTLAIPANVVWTILSPHRTEASPTITADSIAVETTTSAIDRIDQPRGHSISADTRLAQEVVPVSTSLPLATPEPTPTPTPTPSTGTVLGISFYDHNSNLLLDLSEPGLYGTVMILKQGSTTVATAVSNGIGAFAFPDVQPGTYTLLEQSPPVGYDLSPSLLTFIVSANTTWAVYIPHGFQSIFTSTPTRTPMPTPTPTPTPPATPILSISVANVPSASQVNVGDQYWYDVTVTNTSPGVSLYRIVLNNHYNPTSRQCVVAASSSNPGCSLNALAEQWECDIQTTVNPNASFSVRFFYLAVDNCTAAQNANTATAVGYQGTSSSSPVSASSNVTIN